MSDISQSDTTSFSFFRLAIYALVGVNFVLFLTGFFAPPEHAWLRPMGLVGLLGFGPILGDIVFQMRNVS